MSKKIKLNLGELHVQSFVTSLDDKQKDHVRAGISGWVCPETYVCATRLCTDEEATCTAPTFEYRCYQLSLGGWTNCEPF
jgi:hypothetical protein